jgi:hypothetical protein
MWDYLTKKYIPIDSHLCYYLHILFHDEVEPYQKENKHVNIFFCREGPRSRCYGRTTTRWWRWLVFFVFTCNGAPVEWNRQGKTEVLGGGGNFPSAISSTTNPTGTEPVSNPGLRGERPATNRLSHGTAYVIMLLMHLSLHATMMNTNIFQSSVWGFGITKLLFWIFLIIL